MERTVIGMDLGDKQHYVAINKGIKEELSVCKIGNTKEDISAFFSNYSNAVIVMEAGTHSAWITRLLESLGHEVYVGNPRKMRAIWDCDDKSDERDAKMLAMLFRLEPRLLHQVKHRNEQTQNHLAVVKARAQLVEARVALIAHVRGITKSSGERLPTCSTSYFVKKVRDLIPVELSPALQPLLDVLEKMNEKIEELERTITELCENYYPETKYLLSVPGVGEITALTYVLTIEDVKRFKRSRDVGPFLGLTPRKDQSGDTDKQLSITKAGNGEMRRLLVGCAHYILGPFGSDSDLRRYGEKIAARGGKNAKKRAVVAVARKLAVTLHRLWADEADYTPTKVNRKAKVA